MNEELVERTAQEIERELGQHWTVHERIAVERRLEELARDAAARKPDPWC